MMHCTDGTVAFIPDSFSQPLELHLSALPEDDGSDFSFTPLVSTYLHRAAVVYSDISTSRLAAEHHHSSMLDIFSLANSEEAASFVDEISSLATFVENPKQKQFGGFEVTSLDPLRQRYGVNSEEYAIALKTLEATLRSVC